VSSRDLFTREGQPRFLAPTPHCLGHDRVYLLGRIPPDHQQRVGGSVGCLGLGLRLLMRDFPKQKARGFGHSVIDGGEPSPRSPVVYLPFSVTTLRVVTQSHINFASNPGIAVDAK
jgi:hypothetical protein